MFFFSAVPDYLGLASLLSPPCQHLAYISLLKEKKPAGISLHPGSPYSIGQFLCEKMSSVICTTLFEALQRESFQFSGIVLLGSQPEALIVFDRQIWLHVRTAL